MDEKQARYADLIECSARILAFDGIIDAALPVLVSALTSEAVDLRNGWAEFCPNNETGAADLPIVDAVIAEVFARSNALCGAKFSATCVVLRLRRTWPRECANIWRPCENSILQKP